MFRPYWHVGIKYRQKRTLSASCLCSWRDRNSLLWKLLCICQYNAGVCVCVCEQRELLSKYTQSAFEAEEVAFCLCVDVGICDHFLTSCVCVFTLTQKWTACSVCREQVVDTLYRLCVHAWTNVNSSVSREQVYKSFVVYVLSTKKKFNLSSQEVR